MLRGPSLAAVLAVLVGCQAPKPKTTPPPPAGTSYADYLNGPEKPAPTRPPDTNDADAMKLHFIDVGQGAATLLEFPCGAVLIDTGGEYNEQFDSTVALKNYLDAFFERRTDLKRTFDLLVVTHPHIDHTRSLMAVIKNYKVRNVIDNGSIRNDVGGTPQNEMHQWLFNHTEVGHLDIIEAEIAPDKGLEGPIVDPVGACDASSVDPRIRALWGKETVEVKSYGTNPNEHSVVLRVDFGESSALLTGDLQKLGIARLAAKFSRTPEVLDVDIYEVGHHGSRNATAKHQMQEMTPKIAVINAGPYDRNDEFTGRAFGHPNMQAVAILLDNEVGVTGRRAVPIEAMIGIKGAWKERPSVFVKQTISKAVYSTGWDGSIVITANANGWLDVALAGR